MAVQFLTLAPKVKSVDQAIDEAVQAAVSATDGNMTEAARLLCMGRSTLYRHMRGE